MTNEVLSNIITVLGIALVSLVSSIIQYKIGKNSGINEIKKLEKENELLIKQKELDDKNIREEKWKNDFFRMIIELIIETDAEITKNPNLGRIITLVQKLQFMLRPEVDIENQLMCQLTGLAFWFSKNPLQPMTEADYFTIHSKLTELGRKVFYQT